MDFLLTFYNENWNPFQFIALKHILLAKFLFVTTYMVLNYDLLWIFMKAHGIDCIFTLCGGHISPILAGAEKHSIRVIDFRSEANAVFAADAFARMSGKIGVAAVTAGPGLTNTITALKNAQIAETPVLILSGAAPGLTKNRGALQDIDQLSIVKPLCKYVGRVSSVRQIIPVIKEAISSALSGTPGPVFIEFPIDVLYPYSVVETQLKVPKSPKSFMLKLVALYMRFYLKYVFAGAFPLDPKSIKPKATIIPRPSETQLSNLLALLLEAKKPVLILGSQATIAPIPATQTAENVKVVYTTGMSRGILGRKHELLYRHARKAALKEADFIILAGTVCDFRLDYGRSLNSRAKIVSINRSSSQLYLNSDMFWKPVLAIKADVGTTLDALIKLSNCENNRVVSLDKNWTDQLRARENARDSEIKEMCERETSVHNNPLHLLMQIEEYGLTDDSILVVDGGDFVGSASYILRPRGPLSWLDPGAFGTLGVGAGFAIGAKLCRPESTVWIIYGDGSCAYSIAELDTMRRHHLPAIAVIGNDAAWSQIERDQVKLLSTNIACELAYLPYHTVGAAYACKEAVYPTKAEGAFLVTKETSDEQFKKILKSSIQLSHEGVPSTINCLIGSTDFREGSISC